MESKDFSAMSCKEFVEILGSAEPVPGGGGASALAGALGVAAGHMVGQLTVGKAKYADVEQEIRLLNGQAKALETKLLDLIEKDALCFEPLARAYGMKADTDLEKAEKVVVMERALEEACTAPLQIMEACCQAIDLAAAYGEKGSKLAISDGAVGAVLSKGGLQGASLNVFINTGLMKDREKAKAINKRAKDLLTQYGPKADNVFETILKVLQGE